MRHQLFSKFDEGIDIPDDESWYSVTPEKIAQQTADRCRCDFIVDGFCGIGGNSIQFAKTCQKVIAIDIDPNKIKAAKHNAKIYGVEDRIEFIIGDFFDIIPNIAKANVIFLSPPWGGPGYKRTKVFDLGMIPMDGFKIFEEAQKITSNIAYYLPKNCNTSELISLANSADLDLDIEENIMHKRVKKRKVKKVKAITAYFGDLTKTTRPNEI